MRSGQPLAKASVFALAITIAGALALHGPPSVAASDVSDQFSGNDDIGGLRTAEAQLQCNAGWVYDTRKQFCVRAHAPTRTRSHSSASRPSSQRVSKPTKRRVPEASGIRTLCVRACDGYYFPISYSATRKRFKIDEAVCKAMYGGAPADLYFHDNGSPADMAVSLKGKPLAGEPRAFAFRDAFSETCEAELKSGLARLVAVFLAKTAKASSTPAKGLRTAPGLMPVPVLRVIAGTDPETLSNRAGRLDPAAVRSRSEASVAAATNIRRVGPSYYYSDPVVITRLREPPRRTPEFTLIGSALADHRAGE